MIGVRGRDLQSDRLLASPGRGDARPRREITPIEKAVRVLAELSDAEWTQLRIKEDRRRSATEQRRIRDLSARLRELRRGGAR